MLITHSKSNSNHWKVLCLVLAVLFFFILQLNAANNENIYNVNSGANFNNVIVESTGGIICATLFGYTFAYLSGSSFNNELFQSAPDMSLVNTYFGIITGSALGVYFSGKLVGARGSLLKTFAFASVIGGGIQALSYSLYYNNYKNSMDKPNTAVIQLLSLIAPTIGALIGYNTSPPEMTYESRAFLEYNGNNLSFGVPEIYVTTKMNTVFHGLKLISISI